MPAKVISDSTVDRDREVKTIVKIERGECGKPSGNETLQKGQCLPVTKNSSRKALLNKPI